MRSSGLAAKAERDAQKAAGLAAAEEEARAAAAAAEAAAEEAFLDIPVIFLTGSVDKERIQKILPLKPAGYLLKTTKPQEIKGTIDDFFRKRDA